MSESNPKSSCCRKPLKAVLIRLAVRADTALQKKVCQQMVLVQNELRSSIANSSPPMGALNPAATPAATPAVVKARLATDNQVELFVYILRVLSSNFTLMLLYTVFL